MKEEINEEKQCDYDSFAVEGDPAQNDNAYKSVNVKEKETECCLLDNENIHNNPLSDKVENDEAFTIR